MKRPELDELCQLFLKMENLLEHIVHAHIRAKTTEEEDREFATIMADLEGDFARMVGWIARKKAIPTSSVLFPAEIKEILKA